MAHALGNQPAGFREPPRLAPKGSHPPPPLRRGSGLGAIPGAVGPGLAGRWRVAVWGSARARRWGAGGGFPGPASRPALPVPSSAGPSGRRPP